MKQFNILRFEAWITKTSIYEMYMNKMNLTKEDIYFYLLNNLNEINLLNIFKNIYTYLHTFLYIYIYIYIYLFYI